MTLRTFNNPQDIQPSSDQSVGGHAMTHGPIQSIHTIIHHTLFPTFQPLSRSGCLTWFFRGLFIPLTFQDCLALVSFCDIPHATVRHFKIYSTTWKFGFKSNVYEWNNRLGFVVHSEERAVLIIKAADHKRDIGYSHADTLLVHLMALRLECFQISHNFHQWFENSITHFFW